MAVELATAYVALTVETRNIAKEVQRGFDPVAGQADKAGKVAGKRFAGGMAPSLKGIATGLTGVLAAVGVKDFMTDALGEARESQKVGALTANVIKTTGGAAKISAEQVGALAESISRKTGVDDEAIQTGSNLLLTFKNVRNEAGAGSDVFNRATAAAVDLSKAGFGSIDGASKMLGKALNDPIKGISALGRAGVTFTAQQKEQIKTMVESGNVLGAQKIIMAEVESQVGGAAAATATAGDKARVVFDNLKESAGTKLLPVVDRLANGFMNLVEGWKEGTGRGGQLRDVLNQTVSAVTGVVGWFVRYQAILLPLAAAIGAVVAGIKIWGLVTKTLAAITKAQIAIQAAWNAVMAANPIGIVIIAIMALVAAIVVAYNRSETFRKIVDKVWAGIKSAISSVVNWFKGTAWPIMNSVFKAIGTVATWLWQNMIRPHFNNMKLLIGIVATFIKDVVWPKVRTALQFIGDKGKWLWEKVLRPTFGYIKTGVDGVKKAFEKAKDGIGTAWGKLEGIAKKPIKFIIQTVINKGLIDGYNWLAKKIGGDTLGHIPLPKGFAKGGVLPGYTPGRDVHRFYSKTGGVLDLSGGEAVMRPEFTRLVGGKRGVDQLNAMARAGHVPFQAHAGGGIIGWIKKKAASTWNWVSDKASSVYKAVSDPVKFLKDRLPPIPGSDLLSELAVGVKNRAVGALGNKAKALWKTFQGAFEKAQGSGVGKNAKGWQQIWGIVKGLVPGIQLTSAYRPGAITASGNRSMHSLGRAVDLAPPNMAAFNKIRGAFPNATELIYSPAGMRQLKNGRPYVYGEPVRSMHYDHIHLAMKNGGIVPKFPVFDSGGTLSPGLNVVDNRTGGPEHLVPVKNAGGVTVYMTVSVDDLAKMSKVGDFLDMLDNARVNQRKTARSGRVSS